MDKFSEMSHADRIAYLASKVALAKSYDSPVLTVPIPDLEILLAELEGMEQTLNVANDAIRLWKERALAAEQKLATPVQLPRPSCVYADHSYPAYSRKQVEEIITTAGMRFTAEGDA